MGKLHSALLLAGDRKTFASLSNYFQIIYLTFFFDCFNNLSLLRFLIDNKADVNHKDDLGWTPLHWSAFQGQTDTCKLLIANHADVTIENKAHQTALDFEKVTELKG